VSAREVRQRGLWYDEMEEGVVYKHAPGRTVEAEDNTLFSALTMNQQALHVDAAFSAQSEFGQRLVNSLMTLSVLVGQSTGHLTQGTLVANLGFREVTFPQPVFAGDTLYGETTVEAKRLSASRPGQGIVSFRHVARNQHGDVVAVALRDALVKLAP
jgi:acyl dehydratase